jgi:penicillin amidase
MTGFWFNIEAKDAQYKMMTGPKRPHGPIQVKYDIDNIPHVFADNDYDLFYTQGYITARDRLWQMDIESRTAAGDVSEILGKRLLEQDRYFRNKGLLNGAEKALQIMEQDPVMKNVLHAYSDGVNAYIHQLKPSEYPIEFKLLNYAPVEWKPINSLLIFKFLSEGLSGGSDDVNMSNTLRHFGETITEDLFPDSTFMNEPVIPKGTSWDFNTMRRTASVSMQQLPVILDSNMTKTKVKGIGSNNWVLAGTRTKTGYPILANDPHLSLSLPSVWYQIQLSGTNFNVYGVSIPGIPCVVIGFNQDVAWGITNAEVDVVDWYNIRFNDTSKTKYWYNNKWLPITRKVEEFKIKNEKSVFDTVLYTRFGPVLNKEKDVKDDGPPEDVVRGFALRWIAAEPSQEIKTFYLLNSAKNYDDYRTALQYFTSPPLNFIFASSDKDIAITSGGRFPLRYQDQGKYILDGSDPNDDWKGWVPSLENPSVKNPSRGFLSSANQALTDLSYPYYLSWNSGSAERAIRINEKLQEMKAANADSLMNLQNDTYSVVANAVLPVMLSNLDRRNIIKDVEAVDALKHWNYRYDGPSIGAKVFDLWWNILYEEIWKDNFSKKSLGLHWPSHDRTVKLLIKEPQSQWFDDLRTPVKEDRTIIINRAFVKATDSLKAQFGNFSNKWGWSASRKLFISHLAHIDAFSTGPYTAGGSPLVIDALSERMGPSWKMVVELGPEVKAYGVFPGGQSGNPGSYFYDNLFSTWQAGRLKQLLYLKNKNISSSLIRQTLTIK